MPSYPSDRRIEHRGLPLRTAPVHERRLWTAENLPSAPLTSLPRPRRISPHVTLSSSPLCPVTARRRHAVLAWQEESNGRAVHPYKRRGPRRQGCHPSPPTPTGRLCCAPSPHPPLSQILPLLDCWSESRSRAWTAATRARRRPPDRKQAPLPPSKDGPRAGGGDATAGPAHPQPKPHRRSVGLLRGCRST